MESTLTLDKDEFIKLYGDVVMTFSSYYKYSFCFMGTKDDLIIHCKTTENKDDCYYLNITNTPKTLSNIGSMFASGQALKNDEIIHAFDIEGY